VTSTGRPFALSVVSIGRVRAGKIVAHKDYWDLTDYLRQVGLMPSAATGG
jgi:ketosteroid isomerase-like protein